MAGRNGNMNFRKNRPLYLLLSAAAFAVGLVAHAQEASPEAAKALSPAEEAFDAFFKQVQRDPGSISRDDMLKGLKTGLDLGRPVTAASAARLYLGQTQAPAPEVLRLAGDAACQAGDLVLAATRYRQYAGAAQGDAEAGRVAALMCRIQVDYLNNYEEAFQFMVESGDKFRASPEFRAFDLWFLRYARNTRNCVAHAGRIATMLGENRPIECDRLQLHGELEWLLDECRAMQPAHLAAAAHLKTIAGRLRESPALQSRTAFAAAAMAYRSGVQGKDDTALKTEVAAVTRAAVDCVAADPAADTLRYVSTCLCNDANLARRTAPDLRNALVEAFLKLPAAERDAFAPPTDGAYAWFYAPEFWTAAALRDPAYFQASPRTARLRFVTSGGAPKMFALLAPALKAVPSVDAAVVAAVAADNDPQAAIGRLVAQHAGLLSAGGFWEAYRKVVDVERQLPRDEGAPTPDATALLARFTRDTALASPLMLDPAGANAALRALWAIPDAADPANKAAFVPLLESMAWVPYADADSRAQAFRGVSQDIAKWAAEVREDVKAGKDGAAANAETVSRLDTLVKTLSDAGFACDPAVAPDDLCRTVSSVGAALAAKDQAAFDAAARSLVTAAHACDDDRTPFAFAALLWLGNLRGGDIDPLPVQLEALAGQAARDPGGPNRTTHELWAALCSQHREWGNLGRVRPEDKEDIRKVSDTLAKVILDGLQQQDQFSPTLFWWFRTTRVGAGWKENSWNADVVRAMAERQNREPRNPGIDGVGGAITLVRLCRDEFAALQEELPPRSAFDDLMAREVAGGDTIPPRDFWNYSPDSDRKVRDALANRLAQLPAYPFGAHPQLPVFHRDTYWDAYGRAITGASEGPRAALAAHAWNGLGSVFFDDYAVGACALPAFQTDEASRAAFFGKLAEVCDRAAQVPGTRCSPPYLPGLEKLAKAEDVTNGELDVLLRFADAFCPYDGPHNKNADHALLLAIQALRLRGRSGEVFPLLAQYLRVARELRNGHVYNRFVALGSEFLDAGETELAAAVGNLASVMQGLELNSEQRNAILAVRAKALAGIGGTIPVDRGDARYPIFAAQADFLVGKFGTAWEWYLSAASRLPATLKELDPAFVLWLVERHTDVGDFDQAEDIARQMLQWAGTSGQGFDREARARLQFDYATIAKARQEYPKARAMYEQIAAGKEYDGTQGQRAAELGIAEIDRLTRQYDAALARLDKLSRRNDPYLQAEANYQMALIRFDQEEYVGAKELIEKVFVLEPAHVNGRLLEGKINLSLKKLVEATEVTVGQSGMQEVLVPGKPLKVQLMDRNLAVVGQGSSIEVRAWTDSGDEEFLTLLPFGDSRTKFEGTVPTALGAPEKGDRILQVRGGDFVHYDFSERFMKANKIEGSQAVAIRVASAGEIFASSGRILSREEQENLALERMIRERLRSRIEADDTLLSTVRKSSEIKPGNPINVRVIDPDRSGTPEKDTVTVRVSSTSGDAIDSLELVETEPFSGVFEGQIPTLSAPATAFASDSEEGREPVYAIAGVADHPGWAGLPDGRRPKTLSVDLNELAALGTLTIAADETGHRIKRFALQTSKSGREFQTVAAWPDNLPPWNGTARFELARLAGYSRLPRTLEECRDYMDSGYLTDGVTKLYLRPLRPEISFKEDVGGHAQNLRLAARGANSWYIGRFSAAFYLEQRQMASFRVDIQGGTTRDINAFLAVDGIPADPKTRTFNGSLGRGGHVVEFFFAAQRNAKPTWTLLSDIENPPELTACSDRFFDPARFPKDERAPLFTPAEIQADEAGGVFTVTFPEDTEARTLRIVAADFEGQAPAIRSITLDHADGGTLLPPPVDIVSLRRNRTLEIVPGDRVTIAYEDPSPLDPKKAVSEAQMTATFNDATVEACFVESILHGDGVREPVYIPMRRFCVGDALTLFVSDPDMDVSDQRDQVTLEVRSGSAKLTVQALETEPHSGIFLARIFPVEGEPSRDTELRVGPGDDIEITYLDVENTQPGIPWPRKAILEQAVKGEAELRVYSVQSRPLTDDELAAPAKVSRNARIRDEQVRVSRTLIARRPRDGSPDNVATTLVAAPLLVELLHPAAALSGESEAVIFVQTERGRRAAGVGAEPGRFDIRVPGTVRLAARPGNLPAIPPPVGYRDVAIEGNRYARAALDDGRFSFVLPMELAAVPADSPAVAAEKRARAAAKAGTRRYNRDYEREIEPPVLAVSGDDTVYVGLRYDDPDGKAPRWQIHAVQLTSDPWLHVMDRRYVEEISAVHVGETLYPRVIDHILDTSDNKETASLSVSGMAGDPRTITLTETFGHSGVFKGALRLTFAGDTEIPVGENDLPVSYGDVLRFAYAPPGGRTEAPLEWDVAVHKGADGAVAPFTKQFKDPDIAIQTQFTMAEAYFEMAKKHRELGQRDLARKEIRQGRKLLEESLRDSPKSEARAHADYLLAELSVQFADETENPDEKLRHYRDAVNRFTEIVSTYPESAYAPKAQFKKALAFEKLGDIDLACEEYVKLSYRYPDNELVAETIARLGNYFTVKNRTMVEKAKAESDLVEREKLLVQARAAATTAAQVFGRLSERFPDHSLAWKTLVLSGQCYLRAENYEKAVETFRGVIASEQAGPDLVAQAMYWSGDAHMKSHKLVDAYRMFKKLTWDYPESVWAKYARGRLSEDAMARIEAAEAGN
jgi:outer membrane protein assembly factor BamD (BamD/ComL family)